MPVDAGTRAWDRGGDDSGTSVNHVGKREVKHRVKGTSRHVGVSLTDTL